MRLLLCECWKVQVLSSESCAGGDESESTEPPPDTISYPPASEFKKADCSSAPMPPFNLPRLPAPTASRLTLYTLSSVSLAALVLLNACSTRTNLFSAAVSISKSNGAFMVGPVSYCHLSRSRPMLNLGLAFRQVLGNLALCLSLLVGMALQRVFFGRLRAIEVEVRPLLLPQESCVADSLVSLCSASVRQGLVLLDRVPACVHHVQVCSAPHPAVREQGLTSATSSLSQRGRQHRIPVFVRIAPRAQVLSLDRSGPSRLRALTSPLPAHARSFDPDFALWSLTPPSILSLTNSHHLHDGRSISGSCPF